MSTLLQAAQVYVAERFKNSTLQKPLIDAFAEVASDFAISQASARWSDEEIERVTGIFYGTMNGLPEGITHEGLAWAKSGFKAALRYARDHALLSGEGAITIPYKEHAWEARGFNGHWWCLNCGICGGNSTGPANVGPCKDQGPTDTEATPPTSQVDQDHCEVCNSHVDECACGPSTGQERDELIGGMVEAMLAADVATPEDDDAWDMASNALGFLEKQGLVVTSVDQMVGCVGEDNLARIHKESETCDVCAPAVDQGGTMSREPASNQVMNTLFLNELSVLDDAEIERLQVNNYAGYEAKTDDHIRAGDYSSGVAHGLRLARDGGYLSPGPSTREKEMDIEKVARDWWRSRISLNPHGLALPLSDDEMIEEVVEFAKHLNTPSDGN